MALLDATGFSSMIWITVTMNIVICYVGILFYIIIMHHFI